MFAREMKAHQHMWRMQLFLAAIIAGEVCAQSDLAGEEKWGLVLEHPAMKDVVSCRGIEYWKEKHLQLDIYTPPDLCEGASRGSVVFFTEMDKDRSWEVYQTWPKLVAAFGLIGIAVDVDKADYGGSVRQLFDFITTHSKHFQIDTTRLGVYIPSHVPGEVINYLIKQKTSPPIRAAVMFNSGPSITGPLRKDLPVYYVTDDQIPYSSDLFSPIWDEVQKNKAPWTLRFGTGMPIFFESFAANDEARSIIREAVYFFKNHLEPLPVSTATNADDRDMIAALYRADYNEASRLFNAWLTKHPDDQYALTKYAMISFIRKNYVEAEHAYKRVKDLHPVYRIDLVKTLLANGKEDEAERELTVAMRSGKVKRTPYPGIATFLYSLNRYDQGVAYYEMASESDLRGEDFYNMARGYVKIGEKTKALDALEKALKNHFGSRRQFSHDYDLEPLWNDDRFKNLMNKPR
jgi:hypothetical protein